MDTKKLGRIVRPSHRVTGSSAQGAEPVAAQHADAMQGVAVHGARAALNAQ